MTVYLADGIEWKRGIPGEKTTVSTYDEAWNWLMELKLGRWCPGMNLDGVDKVHSILQLANSRNRMHTAQCTPSHPFPPSAQCRFTCSYSNNSLIFPDRADNGRNLKQLVYQNADTILRRRFNVRTKIEVT